jgi:hypothetical protein
MAKKTRKTETANLEDKALNEAIERVYRKYGSDLRSFFRDVREELTVKREEKIDRHQQAGCR